MTDSFHRSLDAALERSKQPPLALDDPYPIPFVIPTRFIAGIDPTDLDPEFLKPINVLWQIPETMTVTTREIDPELLEILFGEPVVPLCNHQLPARGQE